MDIYTYPAKDTPKSWVEVVYKIIGNCNLENYEFESEEDALLFLRQAVDADAKLGYKNYAIQKMYRIIP
jgi:hypothetical protein